MPDAIAGWAGVALGAYLDSSGTSTCFGVRRIRPALVTASSTTPGDAGAYAMGDAASAGAERGANTHLLDAHRGMSDPDVHDADAGHQEEEPDRTEKCVTP